MSLRRQLLLFFAAVISMAAAMGIHESIFNNFLNDAFHLSADARGQLEFPRELPGLLVVLMTGVLSSLAITHLGIVGALVFAAGMVGVATLGTQYALMVIMMVVGSAGMHLLQPVGASVAIGLSEHGNRGARLGQVGAVGTLGTIAGTAFVWLVFDKTTPQYRMGFLCAAGLGVLAAVMYAFMYIPHLHQPRAKMVIRRKYSLYYALEFLAGARKQIFITFGPWVLIKIYHLPPSGIAKLLLIAAILGFFSNTAAGWAIDRFGERTVMVADGLLLILVCLGYGYAGHLIGSADLARIIACGCYVADNLLFALSSSRTAYLSRLTSDHQEITSTLSMGVSINHFVSMSIPAVAGIVWVTLGYERVFGLAAILALIIAAVSLLVPKKGAQFKKQIV